MKQCAVCEHARRDHVMARNVLEFNRRGDFCTACSAWCNVSRPRKREADA